MKSIKKRLAEIDARIKYFVDLEDISSVSGIDYRKTKIRHLCYLKKQRDLIAMEIGRIL